ncbi:MBL fold metallo-hydrolase [Cytophagaceae bacterium YF14B1]|uniref:MBL fold metallo-hydrolase n=1 Tax=Xanthocytophaga flava TaxID=3048013 RepID=A0AAE3QH63_9BACT|nr:MBL fold metallo-hydrolase [Xanthocytophaga flavus]MDJ1479307.1 MBL fold metallo-hydrolase [Xanthocytophaga flavus]
MLHIQTFTFNPLAENTYVLYDDTLECVIIDPGCYERDEQETLAAFIEEKGLKVIKLLNTHGHFDHVFGNAYVKRTFGVSLFIHPLDEATLRSVITYASIYGFVRYEPAEPDGFLEEGDNVSFGNTQLKVLFLPGHAPGHIGFYSEKDGVLIGGDVLFRHSIGRTDLPGGDHQTLLRSIREKVFPLGDTVKVYPGHGPMTTVGEEKRANPYLH